MENAGFVERRSDPEDARQNRIFLTEAGRALEDPVNRAWFEVEEQVMANMTLEERLLLRRLILQIRENLK
jgi:MarR family transcriptional regulator, organic hydroperoxide resistance regulator